MNTGRNRQITRVYTPNFAVFVCIEEVNHSGQACSISLTLLGPLLNDELAKWVTAKQKLLGRYDQQITITLTQDFGEEMNLHLAVARFDPGPSDRTAYIWTDQAGNRRRHEMPPFFISDRAGAREAIYDFLLNARSAYLNQLIPSSSRLIWATFEAASRYDPFGKVGHNSACQLSIGLTEAKSGLIADAFNIWVAARFIERPWRIALGACQMGAEPIYEKGHRYHDFVPVTPIMDTQLDEIVIKDLLDPITDRFLRNLKAKIDERRSENWLEVHFAIFIMMSNVGWIIKDIITQTTEKGLKVCGVILICEAKSSGH